ncbi:MAG: hypothetical protein IKM59_01560 [Oscillospiraceae bacterium]|nr:hypothetical protein [Oscillospiraceae bacterium]
MLYLEFNGEEKKHCLALEKPVFLRRERNGVLLRCDRQTPAQGVLSPDEREVWQLEGRPSLGDGYPTVRIITLAEYEQWKAIKESGDGSGTTGNGSDTLDPEDTNPENPEAPDPEDTDPVIPEDTDPETVLTRAELSEKVRRLEEELAYTKALLGV